ncbi:PD-(D/E)XK nuclease family transposase [Novipirellula aureliae]|uniref:PD-(D/E)XK nuclease family transposase n=1 Tax=Novipirellula aureliae TaxID=2527966 RepID=A0A5C6DEX1_9BACT|nr:Rpn family recombination-promoting nuclease/putative transposase [Novipirellula aureliae]TWU33676.1 PD-(D/E)XK nuclease family transposase [Novipirellula aureliae]
MPLRIKPTVDFAFKKIFGSPENDIALIGLLNAILDFERPIEAVEILNPFSYQEFSDSKLVVLDVRCRDSAGKWLNVEMQVSVYAGLIERLVHYACRMYVDQLTVGGNYALSNRSISICLLNRVLFRDIVQAHHRFQMLDKESGRELDNAIEVHTVEMTKYNLDEKTISKASKLEQWAFLLSKAQDYEAEELKQLLTGIEFNTAITTIETISAKTRDKSMYDQREKAQRDYEWAISGAREEGREEGVEQGKLAGTIQTLELLLGEAVSTDEELIKCEKIALTTRIAQLQQRLRDRQS